MPVALLAVFAVVAEAEVGTGQDVEETVDDTSVRTVVAAVATSTTAAVAASSFVASSLG